ncbi:hypothetical protein [Mangrovibacterium marinum]|uniref:Uncharacterized protein n=1 Tax=Mangrovibacterium marinum TaxID=1639118 RepID=A0A2T5C2W7_9BACT|nr:hypothetical protein [Mangrovibacterium marinum]PTN09090.1 hypothetical protein C8N47_106190 [Mangrovibacterium marinum]
MKTRNFKLYSLLLGMILAMFACSPDEFNLGSVLSQSDLEYRITQDADDPNMVILESLTPGVTPLWVTPMGRSTRVKDTLRFPFAGDYEFIYGVQSAGGLVQAEAFPLSITTNNFNYVDDPLWTLLTGGVGESKTWYLDLDAEKTTRFFDGPIWFFTDTYEWDNLHAANGSNYIDSKNWAAADAIVPNLTDGSATWYWTADWAGNQWMCDAADFGTMTFDLINGANVQVDQQEYGLDLQVGSFVLDTEAHTISFSDALPLHDSNRDADMQAASEFRVLYLSEDFLQIFVPALGACYNYISEDYRDNWVPEDLPDPEPPYDGDANEDLTTSVSTTKTWKIDMDIPYNWHGLDGSALNEVASTASDGEFAFTTWAPPYDEAAFAAVSMSLTKESDDGGTYVVETLNDSYEGSYTVDENNNIDFGQPISFFSGIGGWLSFGTTAENTLRIIISEKDALGNIDGIWLGQRSTDKDEYLSLHLTPVSGSAEVDPLAAWKKALVGKTFTPDVNWFVDWVGFPTGFTGGWTTASTFGDDYSSNSWVWDANVRAVAESASLSFTEEDGTIKLTLTQTKDGAPYTATGDVVINADDNILNISIPLVDYAGTTASWLPTTNPKSITGDTSDFYFVSHGGNNLANIDTEGFWLGVIANSTAAGDDKDEVVIYHYVLNQ